MKERTVNLLACVIIVLLICFEFAGYQLNKSIKQTITQLKPLTSNISDSNKKALLDLLHEVDSLRYEFSRSEFIREHGGYDEDLAYLDIPPIKVGICTECHLKPAVDYNSYGTDDYPARGE
jgi:hypothetical protein